ncbi:MAG: SnoaL-like domain-containing protein [Rhodospirillaceae bacterium]|jgi:ketosteroid isomerase-like protein|nr:SnoaL-like domain-containing protein [Rhodospirillaceae bacterium]MBT5239767.1 SnoaL-like domain-containing protein [Rhodospirillaceae bacterium]MBT5567217.1 SnoaL-like domain-containing protein [Rhodospirillaceae bacterium]MBT6089430.1 SnoaL-like domain-containing protein [Rhodospirillaceae bacterium]
MQSTIRALTLLLVFAIAPAVVAEQQRRGGTEAQYASVQKFHDDTVKLFNQGDLEGSIDDYLERLRVAHTQRMTIVGRDALEESWGKAFASTQKPYILSNILEMEVNGDEIGDWAYILCDFASLVVDQDTGKQVGDPVNGRYIALLEMTADGWKVLLDIDNGAIGSAPHLEKRLADHLFP